MEILYKKEKEEADQLLEQQRLVSSNIPELNSIHLVNFLGLFSVLTILEASEKLLSRLNRY